MTEEELNNIIQNSGGKCWALGYAKALLEKINLLEENSCYKPLLKQLKTAREQGDFRGRVLEINLAYLFAKQGIPLQYGIKQGQSGDIDFCWCINNEKVFIEVKLLGRDQKTKTNARKQLEKSNFYFTKRDDTKDIARVQRDIFEKSSTKKFNPNPDSTTINIIAIDVSELQLGTVDIHDCILATAGNDYVPCLYKRPQVVGIFEHTNKKLTDDSDTKHHPRDYIHGALFLFREPTETAALSYKLKGEVIWNQNLIDKDRAKPIFETFHKIVPRYLNKGSK